MAERRPIVLVGNKKVELPAGDSLPVTDDESGKYFVPAGEEWVINLYHQGITKGGLDIEGDLIVDGQLFLES